VIHHVELGPDDAPVVLFVHGSMDRGNSFAHVAKRLRDRFRVITVDRRGHAHSLALGPPNSLSMYVDDLVEVLAGRPAIIVGHSFGGVLACMLAAHHPELALALVAYEMPLNWQSDWPSSSAAGAALNNPDPADAAEAFMRRMIGDRLWERLPDKTRAERRAEGRAFVAEILLVRGGGRPFDPDAIRCPTVMARGTTSPPHLRLAAELMAARIAHSHLIVLAGDGHDAHSADPGGFASLVVHAAQMAGLSPSSSAR
jgi:pimeloyl-ACP methyl ester carboxylesterase